MTSQKQYSPSARDIADMARMSDSAYGIKKPSRTQNIPGRENVKSHDDPVTGVQAVAFQDSNTGEITIAWSGSNEVVDWAGTNADIISAGNGTARHSHKDGFTAMTPSTNKANAAVESAQGFVDAVKGDHPDSPISHTGHSQGGFLAQAMAMTDSSSAVSFGSPSPRGWATVNGVNIPSNPDIVNVRISGDPIPSIGGESIGVVYTLPSEGINVTEVHDAKSYVEMSEKAANIEANKQDSMQGDIDVDSDVDIDFDGDYFDGDGSDFSGFV